MAVDEKPYRAEVGQFPIGDTGDYHSWIELVGPTFNLECHDPDVELEEVQELADILNGVHQSVGAPEFDLRPVSRDTMEGTKSGWVVINIGHPRTGKKYVDVETFRRTRAAAIKAFCGTSDWWSFWRRYYNFRVVRASCLIKVSLSE